MNWLFLYFIVVGCIVGLFYFLFFLTNKLHLWENLFILECWNNEEVYDAILKAPKMMTERQFTNLVNKIKDEEWEKLKNSNKKFISGFALRDQIETRLIEDYKFESIYPFKFSFYEWDYIIDKSRNKDEKTKK